jgi:acyl transferase domain-containing protein
MSNQEIEKYKEQIKKAIISIKKLQAENEQLKQDKNTPIAIIGMACRFPGNVKDITSFWEVVKNGVDTISEIPKERWDNSKYFNEVPGTSGKTYVNNGGFINDIDQFDNKFFDIPSREALHMDPQQRLLLEVSYEAFEHAGLDISELAGQATSVYMGYPDGAGYGKRHLYTNNPNTIDPYSITGYSSTASTGRISYFTGIQGGNVALDTGCSAGLVALHLAGQSLISGDADMALAGGITLITSPEYHIALSSMNALAADGKCKTFDDSANGFVRSEGVGVLVLKRLSDAIRDKDKIWAVVKGSAINQDGHSNGYTAPNVLSQIDVIKSALKKANLSPEQVNYVETHGTGTPIGDPIEMEAIKTAYCENRDKDNPLIVGAVKTNFGHTESASGIAGVIKTVLSLNHEKIPPNLHFKNPNTHISWDDIPVKIPTELTNWDNVGSPRIGAVSSFGISGTNAHVIIEEAPKVDDTKQAKVNKKSYLALPVSAKTDAALRDNAKKYFEFLNSSSAPVAEICASAALRHTHYKNRYLAVGNSIEELKNSLSLCINDEIEIPNIDDVTIEHKPAFVYPGQGSQWIGMGQNLYEKEEVFKQTIDDCEKVFNQFVDWSLKEELFKTEPESRFKEIDVIQPVIFAIEVALTELWKSYGVEPQVVIGHSMGEAAAAYISGALSLTDAARVMCERSRLMKKISGKGSMLAAEINVDEAKKYIDGNSDKVSIAVNNSYRSTVISGDTKTLEEIAGKLEQQKIFNVFVKVDVASHSPQVDLIKDELKRILAPIQPRKSSVPMFSTVKNDYINGEELGADYWVDNLRELVQFSAATQKLIEDQVTLFIEMSPHPILCVPIEQNLDQMEVKNISVVPSLLKNKDELISFATNFGKTYSIGNKIDWSVFYSDDFTTVPLPTYSWQHSKFWLEMGEHEYEDVNLEKDIEEKDKSVMDFATELKTINSPDEHKNLMIEQLKRIVAKSTGTPISEISNDSNFKKVGVTSLIVIKLSMRLEKIIGIKVQPTIFWTYPTFNQLSEHLLEKIPLDTDEKEVKKSDSDLGDVLDELDTELESLIN